MLYEVITNSAPAAFPGAAIMYSGMAIVGRSVYATIRLLMMCAAIFAASNPAAQIYKWVDENGVTNYST